jgi:hypothetical protein
LTEGQVEELEAMEADQEPGAPTSEAFLLHLARLWSRLLTRVNLPVGAVVAEDWQGEYPERVIFGVKRRVTGHPAAYARTAAVQFADGRIAQGL